LIKHLLARNTSALVALFPDKEPKIPGNTEIPEIFPEQEEFSETVTPQDSRLVTGIAH
jgi:hypothetical protein